MIKAIALDDEPLALNVLEIMCKQQPQIELVQTFTKPSLAKLYLETNNIDLIFLDIQMPEISGIDFFKSIQKNILVVFTTAYSEYAIEGFNVNAVDFLLKPFSPERLNVAIDKANELYKLKQFSKSAEPSIIQVKSAYSLINVNLNEVLLIEGLDDYIKIHLPNKKFVVTRITMKKMMETLDEKHFIRIHRSFIVPIAKIESVRNKHISIDIFSLPIGASYEEDFFKQFNANTTSAG
jgi:DNA-binding LytR/AlgR family response regulator